MSAQKIHYILIGAQVDIEMLNQDIFEDEENDDMLSEHNHRVGKLAYLYDGVDGKYFIVGIPLKIDKLGFDLFEFGSNIDYIREVAKHVDKKFGQYVEPHFTILTHYT